MFGGATPQKAGHGGSDINLPTGIIPSLLLLFSWPRSSLFFNSRHEEDSLINFQMAPFKGTRTRKAVKKLMMAITAPNKKTY